MKKITQYKNVILDFIFCVGAMTVLNVVTQFVVYPKLNQTLGTAAYGDVLFMLSVITVIANSFGSALVNTRLTKGTRFTAAKFNLATLAFCAVGFAIVIPFAVGVSQSVTELFLTGIYCVLMILRIYASVKYRIDINYLKYFLFCSAVAAMQVLGLLLYKTVSQWCLIFILGELGGLLYAYRIPKVKHLQVDTSEGSRLVLKTAFVLALAYSCSNFVVNADRIIIKFFLGSEPVAVYYVASLIGKICALIAGPLTSILLSYYHKYKFKFTTKSILLANLVLIALCALLDIVLTVLSRPVLAILYPDILEAVMQYLPVAMVSQISYLAITLQLVLLLTFSDTSVQLKFQMLYCAAYVLTACVCAATAGLRGFAIGTMTVNLLFVSFLVVCQIIMVWRQNNYEDRNSDRL